LRGESGCVAELVECLVRILNDPDLASRLSLEGRKLAEEEFDWNKTVSRTTEFYLKFAADTLRAG
jgi:glycosyltransferase involved in cell wall biosynthesis